MRIYIASHKKFEPPAGLPKIYETLLVGAALHPEIDYTGLSDNTGENISDKNLLYNELTGLYWVWKNSSEDVVGLCHYRRYFTNIYGKTANLIRGSAVGFPDEEKIRGMLRGHDIVVHNATIIPGGNRRQYESALDGRALAVLEDVLGRMDPEAVCSFKKVMNAKRAHFLNMFIARKELADDYCAWLFPILRETEAGLSGMYTNGIPPRTMGMLGERMLDVWIVKNSLRARSCFSINTEHVDFKPW